MLDFVSSVSFTSCVVGEGVGSSSSLAEESVVVSKIGEVVVLLVLLLFFAAICSHCVKIGLLLLPLSLAGGDGVVTVIMDGSE